MENVPGAKETNPESESSESGPANRKQTQRTAPWEGELNITQFLDRLTSVGVATWGIFAILFLFAVDAASAFFIPVIVAHLLDRLLSPVVRTGKSLGLPTPLGAAIVILAFFSLLGGGVYTLSTPAMEWIESAPRKMQIAEYKLRGLTEPLERMREVAKEAEKVADGEMENQQRVQVENEASFDQLIMSQTWNFVSGLLITVFLLYFLLASGDLLLRKLVRMFPTFSHRKNAVRIVRGIERDLSRYLGMVCLINLGLGMSVWGAMYLIGMPNPALWGALAGLLNFIPYLGPVVNISIVGLVALVSFESLGWALLAPAAYLVLNGIEASLAACCA